MTFAFPKPERKQKERKPMRRSSRLQATRWGIAYKRPRRLTPRDPALVAAFEEMNKLGGDFSMKTRPTADAAYVEWVHTQDCAFARYLPGHVCSGTRIVMCHEGDDPGMGLKCPDEQAFPGCDGGHRQWTDASGEFKDWKKPRRRAFAREVGPAEYARFLSSGSRRGA